MRKEIPILFLLIYLWTSFYFKTALETKTVIFVALIFFLIGTTFGNIKLRELSVFRLNTRFLTSLFSLFLIVFVAKLIKGDYKLVTHRSLYWEDPSYLFGNVQMFVIYTWFVLPAISVKYLSSSSRTNRLLFAFLLILDSAMSLSRFNFMVLLFGTLSKRSLKFYKSVIVVTSVIVAANLVLYFRLKEGDSNIDFSTDWFLESQGHFIRSYLLSPVIIGDELMSGLLINPLNLTYGLTQLLNLLLNNYGVDIVFPNLNAFILTLSEGFYSEDLNIFVNAFCPNIFIIYRSLGFIGLAFYGVLNGLLFCSDSTLARSVQYLFIIGLFLPTVLMFWSFMTWFFVFISLFYVNSKRRVG